jgi:hypothetical protein
MRTRDLFAVGLLYCSFLVAWRLSMGPPNVVPDTPVEAYERLALYLLRRAPHAPYAEISVPREFVDDVLAHVRKEVTGVRIKRLESR